MSKTEGSKPIWMSDVVLLTDRYRNRWLDGWIAVKLVQLGKVVQLGKLGQLGKLVQLVKLIELVKIVELIIFVELVG